MALATFGLTMRLMEANNDYNNNYLQALRMGNYKRKLVLERPNGSRNLFRRNESRTFRKDKQMRNYVFISNKNAFDIIEEHLNDYTIPTASLEVSKNAKGKVIHFYNELLTQKLE